jgi:hypothetical protein
MGGIQGDRETSCSMGQVGDWVFIAFLYIAPRQRCLLGVDRGFLGRSSVSLTTYHLLGPPAVHPSIPLSMAALTAVKNRDNEVCSVTASC